VSILIAAAAGAGRCFGWQPLAKVSMMINCGTARWTSLRLWSLPEFAKDSLLEGDGFEPSVPRDRVMVFSRTLRPDSFPEIDPRSEPFSLHPQNLPYRCAVIDRQMSPQTGEAMTKRDRRPVAFNLTISL